MSLPYFSGGFLGTPPSEWTKKRGNDETKNQTVLSINSNLPEQVDGLHVGQILISWMFEVHLIKKKKSQIIFIAAFSFSINVIYSTRIV